MSAPAGKSEPGAQRSRLFRVARIVFAAALLAVVAYYVPWRDRLSWHAPGVDLEVAGTIEGNWREDSVRFHVDPSASLDARWPAEVAAAQRSGEPAAITRTLDGTPSPESIPRFEWRPGMVRVFREVDPRGLVIALAMIFFGAAIGITRWWRLLAIAGCATRWSAAGRLTLLGYFFNLIVPGLTGGDVVKAVLAVREHPERRADALMSVIVDRGLGLIVLVGLATLVVLLPDTRFAAVRIPVVLTFLGMLVGLWLFLHPIPRRLLRIESILARLPQKERVRSLDRALRIYGAHPFEMLVAVLLSIVNHASLAWGLFELGRAFGDHQLGYFEYLGVASIANTISSVPIAPGGWGVGEAAYASLFHLLGAPATLGIAVSVTYRLLMMVLSLFGGIFLLLPGGRSVRDDIERGSR